MSKVLGILLGMWYGLGVLFLDRFYEHTLYVALGERLQIWALVFKGKTFNVVPLSLIP